MLVVEVVGGKLKKPHLFIFFQLWIFLEMYGISSSQTSNARRCWFWSWFTVII